MHFIIVLIPYRRDQILTTQWNGGQLFRAGGDCKPVQKPSRSYNRALFKFILVVLVHTIYVHT